MRFSALLALSLAAVTFAHPFLSDEYESGLSRRGDKPHDEATKHKSAQSLSTEAANAHPATRDLSAYEALVALVARELGDETFMEVVARSVEARGEGGGEAKSPGSGSGKKGRKGRRRGRKGRKGKKGKKGGKKGGKKAMPGGQNPGAAGADPSAASPDTATQAPIEEAAPPAE
ncbi:hypothetical protein DXG01_011388 [Tephrocybe rancida]|nr:hypothetical protein DXG01_011388 [Tephrocybe rancida]